MGTRDDEEHAEDCPCSTCRGQRHVRCRRCGDTIKLKKPYMGDPDFYVCPRCAYGDDSR